MAAPKDNMYKVSSISLDPENYRHIKVKTDVDAMKLLLEDRKHKVLDLAEDIVKMGKMDPTSKLIVREDKKNPGFYTVLEGNRRITSLKVLTNPSIAHGTPDSAAFAKLSKEFLKKPIRLVECVELSDTEAKEWIRRRHYKGQGGIGSLDWDAIARARSDADEGSYAKWLAVANFLEAQGYDVTRMLEKIENKSTTVDRVLGSRHMKEILGVSIQSDGKITFENSDESAGADLLETLMTAMGEKSFVETVVSNVGQQADFLKKFEGKSVRKSAEDEEKSKGGKKGKGGNSGKEEETEEAAETKKKSGKASKGKPRQVLADKGLDIELTEMNSFYEELKRLKVVKNKHVSAAMLRVFLDKATSSFLLEMKVSHPGGKKWDDSDVKLRFKVQTVLDIIDSTKKNKELKYARNIADGVQSQLHTLDLLNDYIHHHKAMPAPSELITVWDRLHPYYVALFEHMNTVTTVTAAKTAIATKKTPAKKQAPSKKSAPVKNTPLAKKPASAKKPAPAKKKRR